MRAAAGAAGHALAWALLLSLPQSDERAKRQTKKKVVIVGEGKVPDSLDEGKTTSSCMPKTRLHNFFRNTMCSCVVEVQHDERTPVLPTSPTISKSLLILFLNSSPSVAFIHHERKCIKDTLQIDPELPRQPGPSLFTMSASMVSSRSAPRLARERCQVAACRLNTAAGSCPVPF